jgi:hypothetical protein
MIITQGYPLWVVVSRPNGTADAVPVIAWRYEGERLAPHPITTDGVLDPGVLGAYLTSQAAVDKFRHDFEEARAEAAEGRAGGATFEMSRSWQGGSTRAWRTLRAAVLLRDGGLCQIRTPGTWIVKRTGKQARCLVRASVVHHVLGKARTGDDMRYLQAACAPCNLHVGEPLRAGAKRNPRPRVVTQW